MRKSGDPFEVEPFPKTFYYPSQQRELSEGQRKICLSPGRKKEDQLISPADEKFLQKTNDMKIHEIPTRENGTTDPDHSSSSKFDESWPSTERAMVSTPEAEINISEMSKTPSSTGSDLLLCPLPDSTLARYIHRFRNAPPSSRQARDRQYTDSGKGGEFWWLSEPSPPNSSTPKERTPPERLLGPSPRPSLSPKQKRGAARRGKATVSPISALQSGSSPSKSSLDGLDPKTADLQQRAQTLLEKSESTLETSSSEVYRPTRKPKQGPLTNRTCTEVPPQHELPGTSMSRQSRPLQPRPVPPPEEDILYQWRLARKMERAQEKVLKWGPTWSSTVHSQPNIASQSTQPHILSSTDRVPPTFSQIGVAYQRPELQLPAHPVASRMPIRATSAPTKTQTSVAASGVIMTDNEVSPVVSSPSRVTTTAQAPTSSGEVPSVVIATSSGNHDGVPSREQSRVVAGDRTEDLGHVQEPVRMEREHFVLADVPSHMHLSCDILPCPHQKSLIEKGSSDCRIPLSSPVIDSWAEESHTQVRDTNTGHEKESTKTMESGDDRQNFGSPRARQNGLGDQTSHRKVEPPKLPGKRSTSPEITGQEKDRRREAGRERPKEKTETSLGPGPSDVLHGVIGQVVSERLFCTSTPHSSTSSLSGSEEFPQKIVREPEKSYHIHALEDENADLDGSSDNEFPDDELLKMLRQRARRYREQLRQIDNLLNQHTPISSS